ncbi:DUF1774-domain-containing protein [Venturia nashicola]|uniref:DUF1774-domain-containing protein n=1 Tax=Venturia nashicola TaxID=86259 RepID=A0A4Z1P9R2_9PEZI|nr:DUF1774-domain-containing protein [Venturia nashicola]
MPELTNPFREASSYSKNAITAYKILTPISWLVLVITSIYYAFEAPHEGKYHRRTIWSQNSHHHTPFALNRIIVSIYWVVLYVLQVPYLASLFQTDTASVTLTTALNLAPWFISNNLLLFGFIHLWCRSFFWWALLLVIINFFQLTMAYFRYSPKISGDSRPAIITHFGILAGPLAWSFVALYWDGAAAVHAHHFAARVVANVFIWTWAVYGGFYLVVFKDWAMGFCLSVLTAALGVSQFLTVIVAVQWIEAFTIMALLFVASVGIAAPGIFGKDIKRGDVVSEDRERAPLLAGGESV